MEKETIKTLFVEEAFMASSAKYFGVTKESYHYKNLNQAADSFYEKLTKNLDLNEEYFNWWKV